jgi:hypothetical protein
MAICFIVTQIRFPLSKAHYYFIANPARICSVLLFLGLANKIVMHTEVVQ